ncbi:GNAT family N-acetyltransferase [Pseudodesulfovibrio piezophilus]|uniref:GCN5-related N-acetyltransferase n=1 Tax=Pseudodesulfovibrio piezophilus (strain DSM 21447 / JCM 15486 / C1TLV30) TaxID=1322246 RepID=M1WUD0_PSEP2|nr:GNAT family N-acetyltransferase [Pseudodesulfovibrio piezophilus]CCH50572.1 GCN5-related N-acetyltransferase [Pseudodesulfovibrio piezophilus C1TLV30]
MSEFTVRMVEPDDLTACHTIESQSFPPCEAALTTSLEARITTYPEGFFVAECAGKVIGQINSGSTSKDDISDEEFKQLIGHDPEGCNIVIFSLSVLPKYRKRGIGSLLLASFIAQAKELGKSKVLLLCKEALIAYYVRHGFKDAGLSASTHGGVKWHEMTMTL